MNASLPEYVAIDAPYCPHDNCKGFCCAPVYVRRGTRGYFRFPFGANIRTLQQGDAWLMQRFGVRLPTQAERDAAWCGSEFGWAAKSACPLYWAMRHDVAGQRKRGEIPDYDPRWTKGIAASDYDTLKGARR